MEIKIKVELSATPEFTALLTALLGAAKPAGVTEVIARQWSEPVKEQENGKAPEPEKTVKAETKKKKTEAPVVSIDAPTEQPTSNGAATSTTVTAPATDTIGATDLRVYAVSRSKAGHKDVIKKWMNDNGHADLQSLLDTNDAGTYTAFHNFLKELA